jgi:hypothetical protein
MRFAVVLALIASLAMPSASFAAQERSGTPQRGSASPSWSTIRSWDLGAEVTVSTSRSESNRRYLIGVDDAAIALLDISGPRLPAGAAKLLRRQAKEHPEYFLEPDGKTIALDDHMSFNTSGLFVADQKVAEFGQIVERIPRAEVEGGTVFLDVKRGMRVSTQILIVLGVVVLAPPVIYAIACATAPRGCA